MYIFWQLKTVVKIVQVQLPYKNLKDAVIENE